MCIFCKIINNEIPSKKIYEDDEFLAILDLGQATKGHTLVMPKKHYDNILLLDDDTASKYLVVVKKVARLLVEKLNAKGVNILNNTNEIAGQTINHVHIHILPRYNKDELEINFKDNSNTDLEAIKNQIV